MHCHHDIWVKTCDIIIVATKYRRQISIGTMRILYLYIYSTQGCLLTGVPPYRVASLSLCPILPLQIWDIRVNKLLQHYQGREATYTQMQSLSHISSPDPSSLPSSIVPPTCPSPPLSSPPSPHHPSSFPLCLFIPLLSPSPNHPSLLFKPLSSSFNFSAPPPPPAHTDAVNSISFHPSGNYLLSGSSDNTLKVATLATLTLCHYRVGTLLCVEDINLVWAMPLHSVQYTCLLASFFQKALKPGDEAT